MASLTAQAMRKAGQVANDAARVATDADVRAAYLQAAQRMDEAEIELNTALRLFVEGSLRNRDVNKLP